MAVSNPPSYLQGGSHPARGLRRMTEAMTGDTEGALAAGELVVSEKSGTPNMSVDVSAGRAFILGTESSFQGTYFVESRGVENLTISAADATNPRKDIVVARVEDSEESGATDAWSLVVVTGTPAASPSAPAQPANSLLLATVDVAALASSITDANITTSTPVWAPAPVDTAGLVDGAVTEAKLAADSVSAAAIQAGAVGSSEIAANAVGASELADAYYTESESDARFLRGNADDTTTGRVTISNTNTSTAGSQALNIVASTNSSPDAGISFQYGTGGTVINHGVFRMSNSNLHRYVFLQENNSSLGDIQCQAVYYNGGSFGTSDLSMKNKLGGVPGLDFVDSLAPFTGTWKADEAGKKQFFLGAQEVEAALEGAGLDPDDYGMTEFNSETDALAMDYVQLVPVLVQAVKDLKARVEELEGQ